MATLTLELEAVENFLYLTQQFEKMPYVLQQSRTEGSVITVPLPVLKEVGYLKYIQGEE